MPPCLLCWARYQRASAREAGALFFVGMCSPHACYSAYAYVFRVRFRV
ncbi:MAG: hypothetical protein [Microvirus sp.]|nr:MAG: hypothetical protein [Microvirus sp.]